MSSNQLLKDELTAFCRSYALSKDGLRAIFEGHGVVPNDNDTNISYEFFHEACLNKKVTEGILRYLLEYFPNAARYADGYICDEVEKVGGCTPLHSICFNKNVTLTLGMMQLLIDAFPDSVRHENNYGFMPLHVLCDNKHLDNDLAVDILKLLYEKFPESVRHAARYDILPLHAAAGFQSPEFCRILIEAYPGSERMGAFNGMLPFHAACALNTVATAEYLYRLYPESINVAGIDGLRPIHHVISGLKNRINPETAVEVTQFLLDCNPSVVLQECNGKIPFIYLHLWMNENEDEINDNRSRLNECLKILQLLYDEHPDVIEDNEVISNVGQSHVEVQIFINTQLAFARQAKDRNIMTTRDDNGQLPLHRAFYDNTPLGSIMLLVKGNPSAISCADNRGRIPLHSACLHHKTPAVVEYLIKLNPTSLRARDFDDNTSLHYACRGANHAIIALLTEKYGAVSVSKRNAHGQLPIDLLLQNKNEVRDEESVKYTESIFRLLRAYPMTLMHYDLRQAGSDDCISQTQSKKKRKV